jgi:signal transduction histidine kinase
MPRRLRSAYRPTTTFPPGGPHPGVARGRRRAGFADAGADLASTCPWAGRPAAVEATAYFVVAEALTNVAKHARARHADVTARIEDRSVQVQIRDDGV